jgi:uncharacterized protein YceK
MAARTIAVGLALLALLNNGCGTPANTVWLNPGEGGKRVYGGVRVDLQSIETATTGSTGICVGGEEVKDRKRQVGTLLFFALDLPFSAIGDTLTLPYTLASECGLFGWRCVYEPTTYPKALDESAGVEAPPGSGPSKENKFTSWTLSHRVDLARAEPTPGDQTTGPLQFLEAMDRPVAASFPSFSGSRDAPCVPSIAIRRFGHTGGGPMRGITIAALDAHGAAARPEGSSRLRLFGITPVALEQR